MNRTLIASAAAVALLAFAAPASAFSIRECNEQHDTFLAKRACAGNPGTSSATFGSKADASPSEPGGEEPGGNPGHGHGHGWGHGHGHGHGWGHGHGHGHGWGHGHGHGHGWGHGHGHGHGWGHGPRKAR